MKSLFSTKKQAFLVTAIVSILITMSAPALADHQWGNYKWKGGPIALEIVDNTNRIDQPWWAVHLATANDDWDFGTELAGWTNEDVLDISSTTGVNTACDPVSGNVQVCNGDYGNNGWLGIAQIWLSRGKNKNIIAGVAKLNDYYHDNYPYDTDSFRQLVMCQEVAHTFGLGHQDENFDNPNLETCMDYTSDPVGNERPNQHDYDQLEQMYGTSSEEEPEEPSCNPRSPKCQASNVLLEIPGDWGRLVSGHGGNEVYEKDLGNGYRVVTHVTWTLDHAEDDIHRREMHGH